MNGQTENTRPQSAQCASDHGPNRRTKDGRKLAALIYALYKIVAHISLLALRFRPILSCARAALMMRSIRREESEAVPFCLDSSPTTRRTAGWPPSLLRLKATSISPTYLYCAAPQRSPINSFVAWGS